MAVHTGKVLAVLMPDGELTPNDFFNQDGSDKIAPAQPMLPAEIINPNAPKLASLEPEEEPEEGCGCGGGHSEEPGEEETITVRLP